MEEIQKFMKSIQCEPDEFEGRIILTSMFNEIEWRENDTECIHNSIEVLKYARRIHVVIGDFWDQDSTRRGTEPVLKNRTMGRNCGINDSSIGHRISVLPKKDS